MFREKIQAAIEDIQNGKFVIVTDDVDRENEGDLIMASEMITPEAVNFMAKYARGLICVSINKEDAKRLQLDLMEQKNTSLHETNFTVSIDAVKDTTTGISAQDRSKTIRLMVDENSKPEDFARPGHIFPILAKDGGILRRSGHTEASLELADVWCRMRESCHDVPALLVHEVERRRRVLLPALQTGTDAMATAIAEATVIATTTATTKAAAAAREIATAKA